MTAWRRIGAGALAGMLITGTPARADVTAQSEQGFVSRNVVVVAGSPAAVWKKLVTPAAWWSSDHTFSGDAANMALDPVAGGCFCEVLPGDSGPAAKAPAARGGVQHMRVVFVDRAKALRMVGALGPLQSEAVNATLTITLKEVDGGTRVIFEYVVGGYMRYPADKIANAVDIVMGNQLVGLAKQFGPVAPPRPDAAPQPQSSGPRLDPKGLLLPRGKVWSLPSGPAPDPAPAALPAGSGPIVAPLPTAPVQEDLSPAGGGNAKSAAKPASQPIAGPVEKSKVVKSRVGHPVPVAETVPEPKPELPPAPQETPPAAASVSRAPDPVAKPAPKTKPGPGKPAKPVSKPAPPADEPSKDSINSAFDAAFGGAPRPAPDPQ